MRQRSGVSSQCKPDVGSANPERRQGQRSFLRHDEIHGLEQGASAGLAYQVRCFAQPVLQISNAGGRRVGGARVGQSHSIVDGGDRISYQCLVDAKPCEDLRLAGAFRELPGRAAEDRLVVLGPRAYPRGLRSLYGLAAGALHRGISRSCFYGPAELRERIRLADIRGRAAAGMERKRRAGRQRDGLRARLRDHDPERPVRDCGLLPGAGSGNGVPAAGDGCRLR